MNPLTSLPAAVVLSTSVAAVLIPGVVPAGGNDPNMFGYSDPTGIVRTDDVSGAIDVGNPFFQSLGTNGRSCASCHQPSDGWTVVPSHVQARFDLSEGEDPIFRTNDGSNSPLADVTTAGARRRAYSMLMTKGLIRVGIGMPPGAEFDLVDVDDPYGYASAVELSLFRRPLPATNLPFLSAVMWDGRETFAGESLHYDLSDQANGATLGHAAATNPLSSDQRDAIVAFETSLYTAQAVDNAAGLLDAQQGLGGPVPLTRQAFSIGINDALSPGFNPRVFTLFDSWRALASAEPDPYTAWRMAIGRGQDLFNRRTFTVSGVRGLNGLPGVAALTATCSVCHDTPNVGNHSVSLPLDLGLTDEAHRTPDMPLYTFRNRTTGELVKTTDPGRALITGKWRDMSTFKGPVLRGLAARAPYFHNGLAPAVGDVVEFYNRRFNIGFTAQEKNDLVAFLTAL